MTCLARFTSSYTVASRLGGPAGLPGGWVQLLPPCQQRLPGPGPAVCPGMGDGVLRVPEGPDRHRPQLLPRPATTPCSAPFITPGPAARKPSSSTSRTPTSAAARSGRCWAGLETSSGSVSALFTRQPSQLKLFTLAAICTALQCTPDDLSRLPRRRSQRW